MICDKAVIQLLDVQKMRDLSQKKMAAEGALIRAFGRARESQQCFDKLKAIDTKIKRMVRDRNRLWFDGPLAFRKLFPGSTRVFWVELRDYVFGRYEEMP